MKEIKNLAALSVEERRLAKVYVSNMTNASDLDTFITVNPTSGTPDALAAMVSLGAVIKGFEMDAEGDDKSFAELTVEINQSML